MNRQRVEKYAFRVRKETLCFFRLLAAFEGSNWKRTITTVCTICIPIKINCFG